jgi:beta-xylosidase
VTDIDRLVSRLDLDQKIGQINGIVPMDLVDPAKLRAEDGEPADLSNGFPYDISRLPLVRPHGVGHLSLVGQLDPDLGKLREEIARFQEIAREINPFGIATLVHAEGVNGLVHPQGHQFTTPWGQAATWDPSLSRLVGEIAGQQARSAGIHLYFSPLFDLARDIRWGRVHETYGEDPELVARMGIGFIQGVQGNGDTGILATGKHFLGYGHSLGALNQAATQLGRRELVDVHAEPFRRAIATAGLSLIMNSYNEIDGIPAAANHWLLTDLLRGELGFDGLVVSDYGAVTMLWNTYRTSPTPGHAAADALAAGLDVELPSAAMTSGLRELIEDGTVEEKLLDRAVARVLAVKQRLGLIPEFRFTAPATPPSAPSSEEADNAASAVASSAVTLLANDGVLPLTAAGSKLIVVGPAADEIRIHFGSYTSVADSEIPAAMARIIAGEVPGVQASPEVFPDLFQTRLPDVEPIFEAAARRLHPDAQTVLEAVRVLDPDVQFHDFGDLAKDTSIDQDALSAAVSDADVVIAVVGERTSWVGNHTAGEGRTTAEPTLPGNQNALLKALHAVGKKVITVLVSGRPLLLEDAHKASAAVVLAPLLGQVAGAAIADVLFGLAEPGGRSPSTFPRHGGQIPIYHGHPIGSGYDHPTLPRHGYVDLPDNTPLYPFGHGLTYTSFDLRLDEARFDDGEFHVRAIVRNIGERAGSTVVQLYARDEAGTVVRPVRQLMDFARVHLEPGELGSTDFTIPLERLAYTWTDGRRGVESGTVTMLLGQSSADICAEATVQVPELVLG